jgi:hypothetical protein
MLKLIIGPKTRLEALTEFISPYPDALPSIEEVGCLFAFLDIDDIAETFRRILQWNRIRNLGRQRRGYPVKTPLNQTLLVTTLRRNSREGCKPTVLTVGFGSDDNISTKRVCKRTSFLQELVLSRVVSFKLQTEIFNGAIIEEFMKILCGYL